jgi:hypothetical protein
MDSLRKMDAFRINVFIPVYLFTLEFVSMDVYLFTLEFVSMDQEHINLDMHKLRRTTERL